MERELSKEISIDKKFAPIDRNGIMTTNYSEIFLTNNHRKLDGMVERRMRRAILAIGSFWYSAWVDAGKPILDKTDLPLTQDSTIQTQAKMLGRQD